jgi:hypothetical protein
MLGCWNAEILLGFRATPLKIARFQLRFKKIISADYIEPINFSISYLLNFYLLMWEVCDERCFGFCKIDKGGAWNRA